VKCTSYAFSYFQRYFVAYKIRNYNSDKSAK
jgi:hypothetical protein